MTALRYAATAAILLAVTMPCMAQTAAPDAYRGMSCDDMMNKAVSMNNRMEEGAKRATALGQIRAAQTDMSGGRIASCKSHLRTALDSML